MRIDKDNIKIVLILLVVCLSLGYAYINSDLNINGTAQVKHANWDVHWANIQVKTGSVSASTPTISNQTTVTYSITLTNPGDYYEFTVDAVNGGQIDAMIDTISSKLNGTEITSLPDYLSYTVTYSDGGELQPNHQLLHNTTETYKVKVKYKNNIEVNQLPTTNQALNLQFTVTYRQANENAVAKTFTGVIYSYTYDETSVGDTISSINTDWHAFVSADDTPAKVYPYYEIYDTEAECAAFVGQLVETGKRVRYCAPTQSTNSEDIAINYYQKFEVTNNIVTSISICYVSDKEYCLIGGASSYQSNYNILSSASNQAWFENHGFGCRMLSDEYRCSAYNPIRVEPSAFTDGSVQIWGENSWLCGIWFDTDTNKITSFCMQDQGQ